MRKNKMDEIEVVVKRFGDEQSTLLDQFERLSFEVQLNRAILARSLSEPGVEGGRNRVEHPLTLRDHIAEPAVVVKQKKRRGRGGSSGLNKFIKKLLKPIMGRKRGDENKKENGTTVSGKDDDRVQGPKFCKAFSRSVRF